MLNALCDLPFTEQPDIEPDSTPTPADPREPMRAILERHATFGFRSASGGLHYTVGSYVVVIHGSGDVYLWDREQSGTDMHFPCNARGMRLLEAVLTVLEMTP